MINLYQKTLDQLIFLYKGYSQEHRGSTQPFHLQKVRNLVKDYQYDCQDLLIREPLIEHSGSLPIVATTIYPHIRNENVDLGRALIMLAIHDIGELVVGDVITFLKTDTNSAEEQRAAMKLLPKSLHAIYLEIEGRTTVTAEFAKSIDKITPDILDLITPAEITVERFKKLLDKDADQIVPMIKEFKHPYMVWNPFIKNLHLEILKQLDTKLRPHY